MSQLWSEFTTWWSNLFAQVGQLVSQGIDAVVTFFTELPMKIVNGLAYGIGFIVGVFIGLFLESRTQ
ncbi:hypothetical protein ACT7DH_09470 [Bacillus pacificus]